MLPSQTNCISDTLPFASSSCGRDRSEQCLNRIVPPTLHVFQDTSEATVYASVLIPIRLFGLN